MASEVAEKVAHTSLPWSIHSMSHKDVVHCAPEDGSQPFDFRDVYIGFGDKVIADVVMWTAGKHGGWPRVDTTEEQDANAELIVRAVNNHQRLMDALKKLRNHDTIRDRWCDYAEGCGCQTSMLLADVDAAIAAAEGREL